jgi:hypothetical protein
VHYFATHFIAGKPAFIAQLGAMSLTEPIASLRRPLKAWALAFRKNFRDVEQRDPAKAAAFTAYASEEAQRRGDMAADVAMTDASVTQPQEMAADVAMADAIAASSSMQE